MNAGGEVRTKDVLATMLCLTLVSLTPALEAASTTLVINEIDYDQPGTDAAEFIELKNVGSSAIGLSGYSVELVNGNGGGRRHLSDDRAA
jgi:hypothetical protein